MITMPRQDDDHRARAKRHAWLLAALVLVIYVGYYVWAYLS